MRFGTPLLILFLLVMLGGTGWYIYEGMAIGGGVEISTHGYIAMTIGIVLSLAVGIGLMILVFYSNHHGFDEPARQKDRSDQPPAS